MYEVWASGKAALIRVARFRRLEDALRFADKEQRHRSVAIKQPDGRWYRDPASGRSIISATGQR